MSSTDQDWERFAKEDPYWAVLTADQYKLRNLTPAAKRAFFETGEGHVSYALDILHRHFGAPSNFDVSVDFGCGVGRLLAALARRSRIAVGIDISPTMLSLARENCPRNVELFSTLQEASHYKGACDLVSCFIVLQHIPTNKGMEIIESILELLKPGGCGCLHVTFAAEIGQIANESRNYYGTQARFFRRVGDRLLEKLRQHESHAGQMQMNHYDLNELFCLLQDRGIVEVLGRLTNHAGTLGLELFFRTPCQ